MYQRDFRFDSPIGRDRFCRIIDEQGLKVRRKMRKPRTTDSTHGLPTYPNLIKDYIPTSADRLWVSDITYIVITEDDYHCHFCYLSLILDAYTEEIIGWSVGPTLDTDYPMEALRMALRRIEGKDEVNLIHHSDRGCQYACREYVGMLRKHGIRVSMTESGDPKDNAQAERINNTMKNELLKGKRVQEHQRGRGGGRPGRGLLQQPEAAYEHRNEDPVRSVGGGRRQGYDVDKLQAYGNKIQK